MNAVSWSLHGKLGEHLNYNNSSNNNNRIEEAKSAPTTAMFVKLIEVAIFLLSSLVSLLLGFLLMLGSSVNRSGNSLALLHTQSTNFTRVFSDQTHAWPAPWYADCVACKWDLWYWRSARSQLSCCPITLQQQQRELASCFAPANLSQSHLCLIYNLRLCQFQIPLPEKPISSSFPWLWIIYSWLAKFDKENSCYNIDLQLIKS